MQGRIRSFAVLETGHIHASVKINVFMYLQKQQKRIALITSLAGLRRKMASQTTQLLIHSLMFGVDPKLLRENMEPNVSVIRPVKYKLLCFVKE
jgi:hypothetical protein